MVDSEWEGSKGFPPAMQFLSNTLHFKELNYSSKFVWFLELFKLKISHYFETFQNLSLWIISLLNNNYLSFLALMYASIFGNVSAIIQRLYSGTARWVDLDHWYSPSLSMFMSGTILPCKEWGNSTSSTKFQILSNSGLKSISNTHGPIQMELTWIWY